MLNVRFCTLTSRRGHPQEGDPQEWLSAAGDPQEFLPFLRVTRRKKILWFTYYFRILDIINLILLDQLGLV